MLIGQSFAYSLIKCNNLYKRQPSSLRSHAFGTDIPLIPSLIGTGLLVFGLFNIDNKVDLTDAGRMESLKRRKQEKLLNGESILDKGNNPPYNTSALLPVPLTHDNPYIALNQIGIKLDDEEIEIINKRGGGGCG